MNMVNHMTILQVNIHEAKANLSRYLEQLQPGEVLVICKRNVPVAELRLLPRRGPGRRPAGLARGAFEGPKSFSEPLPDDVIERFRGTTS